GEGGFGITYLAQKAQNRQRVVIKTLKDELLRDPNFAWFRDKFRDEALLLSLCRHPNIVQIDNYFTHGNLPCIAMEYVAGEDLWKWVEKRGILSETEALNYIRKVGEAVIVVHEKGLLHRDIKPQNIMVRDNQDAVLIDFGLARGFIPDRTQQMTFGLTHGFAPPEQYGEIGRFAE
ncbi:serine/threonine-protein kinase, partial [Microcoleus sp. HI-ES]|nr:serine/threonine-protein kinase [Microcoleus sp. HI-ES]